MKNKMLKELNLSNNMCFNQITYTDKKIHITKSNSDSEVMTEVNEMCGIYSTLEKYKQHFDISVSTEEAIIQGKKGECFNNFY